VTWIADPDTATVPHVEVVAPVAEALADGLGQPAGTARASVPPWVPPEAAVNVNVSVLPPEPAPTVGVSTVTVPVPSDEVTSTCGETAIAVTFPTPVDCSCVLKSETPADDGALAPVPPALVFPYVIVHVADAASVTPPTWIVLPEIATLPHEDVV
jgi:hypothetical protein